MKSNCGDSFENSAVAGGCRALLQLSCSILIALAMLCGLAGPLHAKVGAGISGIITDATGAIVPGATVQVTATDTGIVTTRQSSSEGFYALLDL